MNVIYFDCLCIGVIRHTIEATVTSDLELIALPSSLPTQEAWQLRHRYSNLHKLSHKHSYIELQDDVMLGKHKPTVTLRLYIHQLVKRGMCYISKCYVSLIVSNCTT